MRDEFKVVLFAASRAIG
jgi:hypothetical protein